MNKSLLETGVGSADRRWHAAWRPWAWLALCVMFGAWLVVSHLPGWQSTGATAEVRHLTRIRFLEARPPLRGIVAASGYGGGNSAETWQRTQQLAAAASDRLRAQGVWLPAPPTTPVTFTWPVRQAAGQVAPGFYAVTQFADHEPGYPDQLQDYTCGQRTYDLESGYNHGGTDIIPWPFPWNQMYDETIEVVAAADGILLIKYDEDTQDTNCTLEEGGTQLDYGNYVALEHADGSTSWYAHLKHGSLLSKNVGESVLAGELLGIVGSSGFSSGPHLHFEVRSDDTPLATVIDPFAGACNPTTIDSRWQTQPAYYDSAINKLTVGVQAPQFNPCPQPANPNIATVVYPGSLLYLSAYFRDVLSAQSATLNLVRPDGQVYKTWTWVADLPPGETYASALARTWVKYLDPAAGPGIWHFTAQYGGQLNQLYTQDFVVVSPTAVTLRQLEAIGPAAPWGWGFGLAVMAGLGFTLIWRRRHS